MKCFKLFSLITLIFLYSLASHAKTIIVSDIDDTIKKANTMGGVGGLYHFFKKKPYLEMRDIFRDLKKDLVAKNEAPDFYYVSAAPSFSFKASDWLNKHDFPGGKIYLKNKNNNGPTYDYKTRTVLSILDKYKDQPLTIIFVGDNSQHDAHVYYDLTKKYNLNAKILIRDVSTEATYFSDDLEIKKLSDVTYFFSERELVNDEFFSFISSNTQDEIYKAYDQKNLVPEYTLKTLSDRIKDLCLDESGFREIANDRDDKANQDLRLKLQNNCRLKADTESKLYWDNYFKRY
jgi:hypothetical protein